MDQATIDTLTAQRFVHYMVTPIDQWEACKIGVIDHFGVVKREPKQNEHMYFNMFHVLVLKMKELLKTSGKGTNWVVPSSAGQFYFGKNLPASNFSSWSVSNKASLPILGAGYSSMKECIELEDDSLFESFISMFLDHPNKSIVAEIRKLLEDGPSVTTACVAGIIEPIGGIGKRKNSKELMHKLVAAVTK